MNHIVLCVSAIHNNPSKATQRVLYRVAVCSLPLITIIQLYIKYLGVNDTHVNGQRKHEQVKKLNLYSFARLKDSVSYHNVLLKF